MASITEQKVIKGSVSAEQTIKGNLKDIPFLDKTLTKEGYSADAKAVGDALNNSFVVSSIPPTRVCALWFNTATNEKEG